jgi:monofunctional glycosyltransferase
VRYLAWILSAAIAVALVGGLIVAIVAFRFANPETNPVTIAEKLFGRTTGGAWIPLASMSRDLPIAVIAREDGRFCAHWGVDWPAMKDAVIEKKDLSALRGASTIPMQLAKNLFLWSQRDYLRKALEQTADEDLGFRVDARICVARSFTGRRVYPGA